MMLPTQVSYILPKTARCNCFFVFVSDFVLFKPLLTLTPLFSPFNTK